MLQWAIYIAYGLLGVSMLLATYRVLVGPTVLDRTVAFDTFSSNLIGLICIMAIQTKDLVHFDLSIMISLLPFMVSVVVAKFVVKGVIIDRDPD
ncbi:MAG TPA: monovalent cation/H+ antiporter complex subunit F [Limnochordia bacterium]|jgi:Multisubunit Na+/H+ antiporter, MnhF subunit|nr:monovalent cation/H+ antiporter complex subunit F [Limnochordia bacterium]